jgi:hypothetical protein
LRAFGAQLVCLATVVAAIFAQLRHLALARPIGTFVIDLHADVASGLKSTGCFEGAPCYGAGLPEVKMGSS